jgi:hypothetical protein
MVAVKGPTVDTNAEYVHSVSVSTGMLRHMLGRFTVPRGESPGGVSDPAANPDSERRPSNLLPVPARPGQRTRHELRHPLRNLDLDTGKTVQPGGYLLTDSAYADLLHRLTRQPNQPIPPGIKEDIEAYYANLDLPISTKKDPGAWNQALADLATLRTMPTSSEPTPFPTYGEDENDLQ